MVQLIPGHDETKPEFRYPHSPNQLEITRGLWFTPLLSQQQALRNVFSRKYQACRKLPVGLVQHTANLGRLHSTAEVSLISDNISTAM